MPESERHELLPALKQIQKEKNGLSAADLENLSAVLDLPQNEVFSVASFYSFLSLKPQGKYVIRICNSLPCQMQEARMIKDCIREELSLSPGEVSQDGLFSLETTGCIGACDQSPAMMINDEVYGNLTSEKISRIIRELKVKAG
jgi:NADH:ubiquinone oxidoreductase subunit E